MKKIDVITIGSALRDVVFYTNEGEVVKNPKKDPLKLELVGFELGAKLKSDEVYFQFGGGAANTGINFAGLGLKTAPLVQLGADMEGDLLVAHLKKKKLNTSLIKRSKKARTGFSFLTVDQSTNEHVVFVYYGANNDLRISKPELAKLNNDWFYISSVSSKHWPEIMANVIAQDKKVAWNPGSTQLKAGYKKIVNYLSGIEVFIVNRDEATELALSAGKKKFDMRSMLKLFFEWGPGVVVITDGRKGVSVYDGNKIYSGKPDHDKPKDTTGAGDCFGSSFVSGLIKFNGDIDKGIKMGIVNTSSLIFKPGAQEGLLSWNQIKRKL